MLLLGCVAAALPVSAQKLGTITFPNSGSPEVQASFLEGVKDLHSFAFDEAAEAFRKVQRLDPNFAMGYWGEAMSYNHPLWAQVDVPAAQKVLARFAPTAADRMKKAEAATPKEKGYLGAVELLFNSPGDKLARDNAYSEAMAKMYAKWPEDDEVSILYALSLLGTVRPGDKGFRRQALAASIALKIFNENPDHPGAAHFIIHAFDDPDHAILALPAARQYAKIAPAAPHALHMPAHIFVQLGMWQDVRTSNIAAYKAAEDLIARMHLPEGREDFHTLSWLNYANLMLGRFDDAKANVELAHEAMVRNPGGAGIEGGYHSMLARWILATGKWDTPVDVAAASTDEEWIFIAGFAAAKRGDDALARKSAARILELGERTAKAGNTYAAKLYPIMAKEVAAEVALHAGDKTEAEHLAKEAAEMERTLSPIVGSAGTDETGA